MGIVVTEYKEMFTIMKHYFREPEEKRRKMCQNYFIGSLTLCQHEPSRNRLHALLAKETARHSVVAKVGGAGP